MILVSMPALGQRLAASAWLVPPPIATGTVAAVYGGPSANWPAAVHRVILESPPSAGQLRYCRRSSRPVCCLRGFGRNRYAASPGCQNYSAALAE